MTDAPKPTIAWLIEKDDVRLCFSRDGATCLRWVTFTDPAAWRFENKDSAECVILERGLTHVRAVEHSWSDAPKPEPCDHSAWETVPGGVQCAGCGMSPIGIVLAERDAARAERDAAVQARITWEIEAHEAERQRDAAQEALEKAERERDEAQHLAAPVYRGVVSSLVIEQNRLAEENARMRKAMEEIHVECRLRSYSQAMARVESLVMVALSGKDPADG
jgi:hypothetical protein